MLHELAQATGLANYVIGVIAGALLVLAVIIRARSATSLGADEGEFLIGVKALGAGFMLHQAYWLSWRLFFNFGVMDYAGFFTENAWIVTPFYALMIFGGLKCMAVVSGFHNRIPTWQIAGAIIIWLSGLMMGIYLQ